MGRLRTDMMVRGSKAAVELKNVLIDAGATYTVLPEKILEEVGAWGPMPEVEVELGNGERVKAKAYGVMVEIKELDSGEFGFVGQKAQKTCSLSLSVGDVHPKERLL